LFNNTVFVGTDFVLLVTSTEHSVLKKWRMLIIILVLLKT